MGKSFQRIDKRPQTVLEFVRSDIWKRIVTHKYPPGYPLREEWLQREFGASRGPIREALRMLLKGGLVEYESRKGFRVTEYGCEEIITVYQLRADLEGKVLLDLEKVKVESLVVWLKEQVEVLNDLARSGDVDGYFFENIEFHNAIIRTCENRPLRRMAQSVNEMSLPTRYLLIHKEGTLDRSMSGHLRLLEALRSQQNQRACDLAREEILDNMGKVMAMIYPKVADRDNLTRVG